MKDANSPPLEGWPVGRGGYLSEEWKMKNGRHSVALYL